MISNEMKQLDEAIEQINALADGFGLHYFPMRYEICPADIIYTFGAYGMPTRFNHWSFGKSFHKMKMQYDLGLSKIYELVINSNPCYAFLLDGNSLIQNKLIVAHVLAHSDFFKNNAHFQHTNRNMVESMSATADRVRSYEYDYGTDVVESFIDAVLAIQEHIDPSLTRPNFTDHDEDESAPKRRTTNQKHSYEDLWKLDELPKPNKATSNKHAQRSFPKQPEKDLVWFIQEHSPILDDWQRDIMTMLRDEMLYFWPQVETKIMNEGWASYWHIRILRELDLSPEETIEFAKLNAAVVQPSKQMLNPYYLGLKIFEDIEKRYGRERIFEVREIDSDISFLRNYLTKELVEELDLYLFQKKGNQWKVTDKDWEIVRDQLVTSKVNGGFPYLEVVNGNYLNNGELYVLHRFETMELDLNYVEKTLPYLHQLWGKTIHLETTVEGKDVLFSYDGNKHFRKFL